MFAALALLSVAGVLLWAALSGLSRLLLHRWHESAVRREGVRAADMPILSGFRIQSAKCST
jgi:hypothetical protein